MSTKSVSKLSIKKILVPTDFSEISLDALEFAAYIAHRTDAKILLLHVYESYAENTKLKMAIDFSEIIQKGIHDMFEDIKTKRKSLLGIQLESHVATGKIHTAIDEVAKKEKVDLIVMGTHGVSGITNIGKYIIGSNAYRTMSNAPCPIITMKEKAKSPNFKDILLPLDSTKDTGKKVDLAIEWAKLFDSTIHVLALTAFWEELFVDVKQIKKIVDAVEVKLEKAGVPFTSHIARHQSPSESVLQRAKKKNTDIVFIISGQEGTMSEMFLGSSARNIISDSKVPVLSINMRK